MTIDFGTATTFDLVDRDGAYLGGVIAPGINLSIEALPAGARGCRASASAGRTGGGGT